MKVNLAAFSVPKRFVTSKWTNPKVENTLHASWWCYCRKERSNQICCFSMERKKFFNSQCIEILIQCSKSHFLLFGPNNKLYHFYVHSCLYTYNTRLLSTFCLSSIGHLKKKNRNEICFSFPRYLVKKINWFKSNNPGIEYLF